MKIDFDKFYTPLVVAKKCIEGVDDLAEYDLIVEPSAGGGAFSSQLDCLAYDIQPEADGIEKKDFFSVDKVNGKHILFIGNPPFGSRSKLAKDFISHAIELGAETVAFVLPNTFNKYLMQKVFPKEWKLKKIIPLDCDYSANGVKYFVPSSFFIWTKKECIDLRKEKPKKIKDFVFLNRENPDADFCINGGNGKIKKPSEVTNTHAEHYVKACMDKQTLIDRLENMKWKWYSSINGGLSWVSRYDIEEQYGEKYPQY